MHWISVVVEAQENTAELISDTLMDLGALSASIEDALADTENEQAIFGEPGDPPPGIWQKNLVSAMFEQEVDVKALIETLEQKTQLHNLVYHTQIIEEQDWVRATQSQFNPIQICEKLWIVPTWHNVVDDDAINITLDPGLAFGTGSHPTTHLCLEWITKHVQTAHTVLDYGCGSGILAIAAKKMGAHEVIGVDIDPLAIEASHFNAEQNNVEINFFHAEQFGQTQTFDIVVANILSSALMVLAPILASACCQGGKIALSGILAEQVEALSKRYAQWFTMEAPTTKEGWILLTGTKK
jgi:ribosomal protein L11 methyltransferase